MNADGNLDIYAVNEFGQTLYTALGKGDGRFDVATWHPLTTEAHDAAAADFNGDGLLDVVVADLAGAAVFINDGSPSLYGAPTLYHPDPSGGSFAVAAGDFNADGKADFALNNFVAKRLDVYLNTGNGTFASPISYPSIVPLGGRTLEANDFNNDGILDLLGGYNDTSYFGLYFGKGDGTFQNPIGVNSSLTRNGPFTVADFDLDGNLDIAVMRAFEGDEVVLLGDGAGGFSLPSKVIDSYSGDVAAGDVNGDGLPDLITGQSLSPGTVNISINTTPILLSFEISAPASVHAGEPFSVSVTARNRSGTVYTNYSGTVHFTSTDPQATLPADAHLTNGVGTFSAILATTGVRTITVADTVKTDRTATTGPINVTPNTRITPPIFAKFPLGLYTTNKPRGWKVLTTANVEHFILSGDAQTLVADFGIGGLWRWNQSGWLKLSSNNPEKIAVSLNGQVVAADFGANGLDLWNEAGGWVELSSQNAQSVFLSSDGQTVVADFGTGGLSRWTQSDGWVLVTSRNPEHTAVSAAGTIIVADFGPGGIARWDPTRHWVRLSTLNAERVLIAGDGSAVVADFGAKGLRRWTAGGGWITISPLNSESISISFDGQTVLADFGANGLRRWKSLTGWTTLTTANVENAVLSSDGVSVVADFGPGGLKLFETGWTLLSTLNPEQIAIG